MICETIGTTALEWNDDDFVRGTACVVEYSTALMDLARKESCGKDVFCREGTWQVSEIMADIARGRGDANDIDLLKELMKLIRENSECERSSSAAGRCLDLMSEYQEEWDLHVRRKRCTNLVCKPSFDVYIFPDLCDGCGKCVEVCPIDAIVGGKALIHLIDQEKCSKCQECIAICPAGAIRKAAVSGIKPKVPDFPVPVGSFMTGTSEESGSSRRRRRGE